MPIFCASVHGYWFCGGLKFAYSHRNWRSPLTLSELPFRLWFIYTFFSLISLQVRPVDWFLRAIAQKTWNHVPFWITKLKFNFKPIFIPQNRQILTQNGTVFFRPKMFDRKTSYWLFAVWNSIKIKSIKKHLLCQVQ